MNTEKTWFHLSNVTNLASHVSHQPLVLFMDYNGYWAPLSALFYSSASRVLVSQHPDSCLEDIVSYYCPHCVKRFPEEDCEKFGNRCPSCVLCPVDQCPLVMTSIPNIENPGREALAYQCGYCQYRSDQANALWGSDEADLEQRLLTTEKSSTSSMDDALQHKRHNAK